MLGAHCALMVSQALPEPNVVRCNLLREADITLENYISLRHKWP